MKKPISLDNERLWIDADNTAAIIPITSERRASQGWDERFKSQVINLGSEGGLDTRDVMELVKEFKAAGVALAYLKDSNEAINPTMISSVRAFRGESSTGVRYFNAAVTLSNRTTGTSKEQWFAATPKAIVGAAGPSGAN